MDLAGFAPVRARINQYQEEMVLRLKELIAIPSVKSSPAGPDAPFGLEIARALEYVLAWGEQEGFRTVNYSGYAGHLEYGEGGEDIGVLLHLDVVPAGEGWQYPPFQGVLVDDRIYGRGALDDKGPAVAVLYALKALKEEGIRPTRKIRVIFGCDEESTWQCMEHYFQKEPKPAMGFAPDADFPLIYCEKGSAFLTLEAGYNPSPAGGLELLRVTGGTRHNVVAESAEALLLPADSGTGIWDRLQAVCAGDPRVTLEQTGEIIKLQVKGVAAHASLPHLGENAIIRLLAILAALGEKGGPWEPIALLAEKIKDYTGKEVGLACRDQISGALTCNLGMIVMSHGKVKVDLDIRYPLCIDEETIIQRINGELGGGGFAITGRRGLPPHYLPAESPLVKTLLAAYQEETGDFSPPLAIGGRTYATALGNGVAFGPNLPGRPQLAHQKDEYISVADLVLATRIYGRALFHLATGADRKEEGGK